MSGLGPLELLLVGTIEEIAKAWDRFVEDDGRDQFAELAEAIANAQAIVEEWA